VPVPAGEDRLLLLNTHPASLMLRITADRKGKYEIAELWSDKSISGTYVIPVYLDGYLYGMTGKIFTCVDAETGETQWKSRGPGDGFPTLVGNQLAIMTKPGALIVANADPAGYDEVTRLDLFEEHSWSAPAFANGRLYLRSMSEIARVDLQAGKAESTQTASWVAATAFGAFLAQVDESKDKARVIDSFLQTQTSFPIIEDIGAVHFVYRGDATDVGIVGDMIGFRREDPMIRVADTDLFYYSTRLEPEAAVNYGFLVDYSDPSPDPRNPEPGSGLFGEVSWFAMPAWQKPTHLGEADKSRQGRLESIEWKSKVREDQTRPAQVYLPAEYDRNPDKRYPVLYIFRGDEALEQGSIKNTLDNLIGSTVEPLIAVMVLAVGEVPRADMGDADSYIEMITTELVPLIDERYRTLSSATNRGVASTGSGADIALSTAFRHPEVFGRVGAIWPGLFEYDFSQIPDADEHPLVIYQGWGTYHLRSPHEAFDSAADNRRLQQALREANYRPAGGEVPEGIGWSVYRGYTDDMLMALYPMR
jgi:enterochelin esterase-like enzyme